MEIPKLNLKKFLKENKDYKILKRCEDTTIIKLPNGDLLKILDDELLKRISNTGYNLETRLKEVKKMTGFRSFAWPTIMLEEKDIVTSYIMPNILGVDFTDYYENIFNLMSYANIHSQIESNIKEGNNTGIVFPDLCTTENIRITADGKVFFIDYDGLQIRQMPAVGFSDFLGTPREVLTKKYYDDKSGLFTKELDKKSAIFLYFVDVFGIDLSAVNRIEPQTGRIVTLDEVFSMINLDDMDIQQKVWKLFQPSVANEFLEDDLYRLAEKYKLVSPFPNAPTKMLIKK